MELRLGEAQGPSFNFLNDQDLVENLDYRALPDVLVRPQSQMMLFSCTPS